MNTATKSTKAHDTAPSDAKPVRDLGADLSPAVKALETAYRQIQRRHPDAPNVTIVVKRDQRAWGHTTVHEAWGSKDDESATRLEIMISGENLRRGAEHVAATLLHEAAHARNLAEGVRDCDVNGRHNAKFKDRAESMGLTVTQVGWHGWTGTTLETEGQESWRHLVATIQRGLDASAVAMAHKPVPTEGIGGTVSGPSTGGLALPPTRTGRRNLHKAECGCGYSIRVSAKVLAVAQPTCQVCGQPFVPVD